MSSVSIIFPHQLFEMNPLLKNKHLVFLVEEHLFFKQFHFHKQKLAFHRASMKAYESWLKKKDFEINYVDSQDNKSDIRQLITFLKDKQVNEIHCIDPVDDWLRQRMSAACKRAGIKLRWHTTPMFLNSREELNTFFKPGKKKFFQTEFYIAQRKERKILVDDEGNPVGGKWSFDTENRKKYPGRRKPPTIAYPKHDKYYAEATKYVGQHFPDAPGALDVQRPRYPYTFAQSKAWLKDFLENRFEKFGDFEDALVADEGILHHSVLTPMLNAGLLTPEQVVSEVLKCANANKIPINSTEGFVRQVVGWREFIRGVYEVKGGEERTKNFWSFKRKIPASFYEGTTGIDPIDITIKKVLKTGYCHHIERLMVLGNFMLLCEFDPDEVYRWFMELFIDAYDWVMVPNVYGMSQFADGGLMATKPYISGSNYLMKMSDYPNSDWQKTWDALFWRFMHTHRKFFLKNPRLGMLVRTFDKMEAAKQKTLLKTADQYLKSLG